MSSLAPTGRFLIAFDDDALVWSPTWTRIDNNDNLVASYTIDRGRQYELDRTDVGRATVAINDPTGILDPTYSGGPYYGKIEPLLQATIGRYNPADSTWYTRFRGFIEEMDYVFDQSQKVNQLTFSLVDIFDILNAVEMYPSFFGDPPDTVSEGQVQFDQANMDDRIIQTLGNANIPDDFYVVFSGNVSVQKTTYSAGESAMTAIQEAADAEFPGVSNVYTDRFGRLAVHGRLAKFEPTTIQTSSFYTAWSSGTTYVSGDKVRSGGLSYECILGHTNHVPPNGTYWKEILDKWYYNTWKAGDHTAVAADATNFAQIRTFSFNRGLSKIINRALAYPMGATDTDIAGQIVEDGTSQGLRGIRTWSAPNLITEQGLLDSASALAETKKFGSYYIDNYAEAKNRVTDISFRSMATAWTGSTKTWELLSKIDISDGVSVTVSSPGGGGFNLEPFFVEGIHEEVKPLNATYDDVTLRLDLSPQGYYSNNPFPTS